MKILGIGGSLRQGSYTYQALEHALSKVREWKAEADLIDLRQYQLPFCDGSSAYPDYPDVERFRRQVQSASGLILATPEYHGSVSGVLKNALDLLSEEHVKGKVVALMAVVGGVHSTNAINTLRLICRHLHCWVLPEQLVIPHVQDAFDERGGFVEAEIEERLNRVICHLVEAAGRLA
jgi:FMN reductase